MSSISSQDILNATSSRAAQRKARLLQIEKEQKLEDAEALKLTEEQRSTLIQSFSSVKVEFCDLDGLQWSGSALRKRAISRPDSVSSSLFPIPLHLNGNSPRNRTRARAQSLFDPASPSPSSTVSSSYFSLDTPLPTSKCDRRLEAFAVLNNVDLTPSFDERTVRAMVSPVKSAFDLQKPAAPTRDLDARPPAKQRRMLERERDATLPTNGGVPMERQPSSRRRVLTRTNAQTDITFGVSPSVVTEVLRGRERLRGSRAAQKVEEPIETDLVGGGTIRFGAPPSRGRRFKGFAPCFTTPRAKIIDEIVEEEETIMTPTPGRFNGAVEYPIDSALETPVQARRSDIEPVPLLKRKRQASEGQTEAEEER
ncbi:hypothetical protein BT96DRAFT_917275 [Gymnopus androsaceus JB14]|uniref:Uncharacterized protein n=1 Tax=Gymnopus androsaceus JB14 TaxID=1447944 RepID=A0A6A4HZE5_9AGAR|nr:hypothetical protein BT96DRAFT_917275 [Gymnopus androsaceus JB14]